MNRAQLHGTSGANSGQIDINIEGILVKLPFLKQRKLPKIAEGPMDEKLVNGGPEDFIEQYVMEELMDAFEHKDLKKFKQALEAMVLGMFDWEGHRKNGEM